MSNFIKRIFNFGKKILSEQELMDLWSQSNRSITDFINLIENIKEDKKKIIIISEIDKLSIKNLNEVNQLINFLSKFVSKKGSHISAKSNKLNNYDKVIESFISNCQLSINLFKIIGITNFDHFNKYLFNNKFENLLNIIREFILTNLLNSIQKENLLDFLYSSYFTRENYLKFLDYFMLSFTENDQRIFDYILPNQNNLEYFINNKSVILNKDFSQIFKKVNSSEIFESKIEEDLLNYYLNILLSLSKRKITKNKLFAIIEYLKENNNDIYNKLKTILDFYYLYFEIYDLTKNNNQCKLKSLTEFVNENITITFNSKFISNLKNLQIDNFEVITEKLLNYHKNLEKIFSLKEVEYFLLIILNSLLKEKIPIKIISSYIKNIINYYQSNNDKQNLIKNLTLQFLIENYSDTIQENLFIFEALEINKDILNVDNLTSDLSLKIKILGVMDRVKIKININKIIQEEFKIKNNKIDFNNSLIHNIIIEYLEKISKNFKHSSDFKFIDNNLENIKIINEYIKNFNKNIINDILPEFLKNYKTQTIKILLENELLKKNVNESELEVYLKLIIESKDNLKENEINDYLIQVKNFINHSNYSDKINQTYLHKLKNLYRYFEIEKVFHDNHIEVDVLKEFNYEHLNLDLNTILEIFIFRKFNIDQIDNLETYLDRTTDIYKALEFDYLEFLFNSFLIFFKYQKDKIYIQILQNLIDMNNERGFNYFEKCLNVIKKSNINLSQFITENNFKLSLLENSENYNLFESHPELFEQIDFSKDKINVKFNMENEDVFTLINLQHEKNNYSSLIKNENENLKDNFYDFIQNFKTSQINFENENYSKKTLKYSIHPKLKNLLDEIKFDYKGKEFQFNTKLSFKCSLYKLLLNKKLIQSFEEILILENFNLDKLNESQKFNLIILIMNLYENKLSHLFDGIINKLQNLNISFDDKFLIDLIIYNLQNVKFFNFNHIEFISKLNPNFNLIDNNEKLELLNIVNRITRNKINIIPFINSDHFNNLMQDHNFNENLKLYYNDYITNINYFKENLFLGDNNKNFNINKINHFLQYKFQLIEIYKNINMNNFNNLSKIFDSFIFKQNIDEIFQNNNKINILFYLKLLVNISNISAFNPSYCRNIKEITQIIKSFKITNDELKNLISEIFNLTNINFILESQSNLHILDKNLGNIMKDYIICKLIIFEGILLEPEFNHIISKNYIILDKFKIFKLKNYIIQNVPKNDLEIKNIYENFQNVSDYDNLKKFVDKNDKMKRDLEKIYTTESYN